MKEFWLRLPYCVEEAIKLGEEMLAPLELVGFPREENTERRREMRWLIPRVGLDQLSKEMMDMGRERGGPSDVTGISRGETGSKKTVERRLSFSVSRDRSSRISPRAWETRRRSLGGLQ